MRTDAMTGFSEKILTELSDDYLILVAKLLAETEEIENFRKEFEDYIKRAGLELRA
jgi:uncharacterized protein YihD (DUF1040 family)